MVFVTNDPVVWAARHGERMSSRQLRAYLLWGLSSTCTTCPSFASGLPEELTRVKHLLGFPTAALQPVLSRAPAALEPCGAHNVPCRWLYVNLTSYEFHPEGGTVLSLY